MAEDMIERAAKAHAREASEWALRVNKAEIEPHEIVRHENPDFVSPVVVESYPNYERATRRFEELRAMASARAALLAALDPEDEALQQLWGDVIDRFSDPASHHCMATFFAELKAMAQGGSVES